jgi:hypothetical protein
MTGGLMQLVAYGAQDIYLTGNPMITYFKVVYRRHTNFAMESIQQVFNGNAAFGSRVTCLISRNGDLVSGITLEALLPTLAEGDDDAWVDDVGHHLIQQVDVDIGGQLIDRHYADWLEIWAELTVPAGHEDGYRKMIGQGQSQPFSLETGLQIEAALAGGSNSTNAQDRKIYVPLQFWFCRNVGLALPLIALQYHEVKVTVQFATGSQVCRNVADYTAVASPGTLEASLWVDYIYLDTDERRRFAQVSHEYLIEQLQFSGDEAYSALGANATTTVPISLHLNHPVKELVWVCKPTRANARVEPSNYTSQNTADGNEFDKNPSTTVLLARNPVSAAKLQLNGHDRFATRDGTYFNRVQTRCHTRIPMSPGINVYSFALKPEDHQPSGTCNFSRIDNARLQLTLAGYEAGIPAGNIKVFATNYNVLRIMSGMGGLAYSN